MTRAIEVLFSFDQVTPALTAADVATRLGINRTTAWRSLQALTGTGLVRELGEGRFALGGRTVGLAEAYTSQWGQLGAVAGGALVRLRDACGETAALHVHQAWSRVVVRQVESRQELHRTYRDLGEPISLLLGSPSRAILAAFPDADATAYLDAHLVDRAGERRRVEEELAEVRRRGYAVSRGSRAPGIAAVAVAIHDGGGNVLGALNVTGPEARFTPASVERFADEVSSAAAWVQHQVREQSVATASPGAARTATGTG